MDAIPVTLKELMDEKFIGFTQRVTAMEKAHDYAISSQQREVTAALAAAKEAVIKAENATNDRFEGVNEFRAQLSDQTRTYIPRAEIEVQLKAITDKFDLATKANAEQIAALRTSQENQAGRKTGIADGLGWIVAICGIAFGLAALIFHH